MFTDWSLTDPHYFYFRGALLGFVLATLLWGVFVPWLRGKLTRALARAKRCPECGEGVVDFLGPCEMCGYKPPRK